MAAKNGLGEDSGDLASPPGGQYFMVGIVFMHRHCLQRTPNMACVGLSMPYSGRPSAPAVLTRSTADETQAKTRPPKLIYVESCVPFYSSDNISARFFSYSSSLIMPARSSECSSFRRLCESMPTTTVDRSLVSPAEDEASTYPIGVQPHQGKNIP